MKSILVYFDDSEHKALIDKKTKKVSWHDFILKLTKEKDGE